MRKTKVAVAMSGGVDSSAAALILKKQGYEVFGITMLVCPWDDPQHQPIGSAASDARIVCSSLGIKHHIVDLREKFKQHIINYFADEYTAGRTPNPCIMCNRHIKFGLLLDTAQQLGAEKIATGHYARVEKNEITGKYQLFRGKDREKDQVYALYRLDQQQLSRTVFPLAEYRKTDARIMLRQEGIHTADRPESQEICFIKDDDYVRFLMENYGTKPEKGPIIHVKGEVIGEHKGLIHYTVGQRKGLGIANPLPLYVVRIHREKNQLIVGYWEDLFSWGFQTAAVNWIAGSPPPTRRITCKIRYRNEATWAEIAECDTKTVIPAMKNNGIDFNNFPQIQVHLEHPQRAVTPGQSAVFYSPDGEQVLGGGIIT